MKFILDTCFKDLGRAQPQLHDCMQLATTEPFDQDLSGLNFKLDILDFKKSKSSLKSKPRNLQM